MHTTRWSAGLLLVFSMTSSTSGTAQGTAAIERAGREGIANATSLIAALERHKAQTGSYPQHLDLLVPASIAEIPLASSDPRNVFVYHGADETFELFFLPEPTANELFLYRPLHDYQPRREQGPWALVAEVESWGWYRLIPMRDAVVVQEWRGRLGLEHDPLRVGHVSDATTFAKLWASWQVAEPLPPIDFSRHLVLTAIVRSGLVMFKQPVIDDQGDLKPNVVATPDAPNFYSWAICVVERHGIRSIRGAPL
jgi:hypothetical protein